MFPSRPAAPEFAGIWDLWIASKVEVYKLLIFLAILGTCALAVSMIGYMAQYERMRYLMEAGEHVHCPDEAIAKIVENGKVTCVMRMVGPADKLRKIEPGWLDRPIRRKEK